ncbi:MAG: glycosyltransferase family 2 protein [Actinomycetaceae bacterium]|nr:glycosyltransferase family 2 protein [Actinomycetaceae bacterium]
MSSEWVYEVTHRSYPHIRVVTVAFRPGEEIIRCAQSLKDAYSGSFELYVCNNAERNEYIDRLEHEYGAHIVGDGANIGYGQGIDKAVEGFAGKWFLVTNPDVVYQPHSLDTLYDYAISLERVGACGPQILDLDGSVYPSARSFPRVIRGIGHALLSRVWKNNPFTRTYHGETQADVLKKVDWLSGASLFINADAYKEIGGFDDNYFMFFEDVQLGQDFHRAHWNSYYVPNAHIVHDQGKSWRDSPIPMIHAHHESARYYLSGVYDAWYYRPLLWMLKLGLHMREKIFVWRAR